MNTSTKTHSSRISSIDILRGLVMLLMLLDHVRERFFYHVKILDPLDIDDTHPTLFFTRITAHLCAPIFVFLTGLSAWLYANPAQKPSRSASAFLFKRGLFLVLLEITIINFSWFGDYQVLYLQVIWAIGISMICLAALCKLDRKWIGIVGALIVFGHNLLVPISFSPDETGYTIWTILHDRGFLINNEILTIKASYPVLPWIGVILLGYFAGPLFGKTITSNTRKISLVYIGLSCLLVLFVFRYFNLYGETLPFEFQETFVKTLMSFINYTKYPPSLDFLLLTIGIGFLLLALFENMNNKFTTALKTYGSAPMFFYIFHLYVLLILYKILTAIYGTQQGEYFGFNHIWQIWALTITLSIALYFPTKYFSNYKRQSSNKWIKYF
ncbi:DUF1624 domain-containing protein [Saccharicrinis aurantiacus]|uniref:DUF1624 domain-containing protein n=1 Tax=Saccharicrinis aurantiacus TaxID=1849719 RepID=UPI0008383965|nr:DUF1624 domain-containing protein [Saccharicrinis aurantiacus]